MYNGCDQNEIGVHCLKNEEESSLYRCPHTMNSNWGRCGIKDYSGEMHVGINLN